LERFAAMRRQFAVQLFADTLLEIKEDDDEAIAAAEEAVVVCQPCPSCHVAATTMTMMTAEPVVERPALQSSSSAADDTDTTMRSEEESPRTKRQEAEQAATSTTTTPTPMRKRTSAQNNHPERIFPLDALRDMVASMSRDALEAGLLFLAVPAFHQMQAIATTLCVWLFCPKHVARPRFVFFSPFSFFTPRIRKPVYASLCFFALLFCCPQLPVFAPRRAMDGLLVYGRALARAEDGTSQAGHEAAAGDEDDDAAHHRAQQHPP